MSTVSDWSYFTPEGERDAREALATIDHADIRGLVTAFHLSVAGLPRSKLGDYPKDAHITCSRIPPHRVPRIAFLFQCVEVSALLRAFFEIAPKIDRL
jgi:hypothetical protein